MERREPVPEEITAGEADRRHSRGVLRRELTYFEYYSQREGIHLVKGRHNLSKRPELTGAVGIKQYINDRHCNIVSFTVYHTVYDTLYPLSYWILMIIL